MIIRRAFYYLLFPAVVVLPAWTLIGWGIFGHGGWALLGLLIAAPIMAIALLVVGLVIAMRPTVRRAKALSWTDVAVLTVWYACLIGFGFFGDTTTLFAVLGVAAALTAFWLSIGQLLKDGARSMRATMAEFEAQAAAPGVSRSPRSGFDDGDGEVIIIHEAKD